MQKYPARAIAVGARWVNKAPRKQLAKLESWRRGGKPLLADVKFFDQGVRHWRSNGICLCAQDKF